MKYHWFPKQISFPLILAYKLVHAQSLSCVWLFVTLWTVAHQAPLSMGFSRQEYWSGLPFPSPGDLPKPRMEPSSPALAGRFYTTELPGKPVVYLENKGNRHQWCKTFSRQPWATEEQLCFIKKKITKNITKGHWKVGLFNLQISTLIHGLKCMLQSYSMM